jgi:hypothetical protein
MPENNRNKSRSYNFQWCLSSVQSALILLPFLIVIVAQHESGTRKAISWLMTAYNKR